MLIHQKNIEKLTHVNNTTLTGYAVDDFFTFDVLNKRLKKPLKQHAETICNIYNLFHRRLHNDCMYTEMFVNQIDQDILFTVFFNCGLHKFMLVFFSQIESSLTHQDELLHSVLSSYDNIKESSIDLKDDSLPPNIRSLIHDISLRKRRYIKLKKIETEANGQNIVFHQVSFPIDLASHRGISILAGFQY